MTVLNPELLPVHFYPIGDPYQIYQENQVTTKRVIADLITTKARHVDIIITTLQKNYLKNTSEVIHTDNHPQIKDYNSTPNGKISPKSL